MRFAYIQFLWALFGIPLVAALLVAGESKRRAQLALWIGAGLRSRLAGGVSEGRRRLSILLICAALVLLVIGASRPQFGSRILETRQRGIDVALAIDLSLSMQARDLPPNRLQRAQQEVLALLDELHGDRIALVSFAGQGFVQCPLTLDRGAIRMLLPLLDPRVMPEPGTNLAEAIRRSLSTFDEDPRRSRAIVILSDGEELQGEMEKAVEEAKADGARICAVGIGRAQGEPIPLPPGRDGGVEYKRDRQGQIVMTHLVEEGLRKACEETGGVYVRAESGSAARRIAGALRDMEQGEIEGGLGVRYEERFGYFVAPALLLLLIEGILGERRRRR